MKKSGIQGCLLTFWNFLSLSIERGIITKLGECKAEVIEFLDDEEKLKRLNSCARIVKCANVSKFDVELKNECDD